MEILNAFSHLLDVNIIMLLIIGTLGGIIIGALPGFTPTMGVALAVPFTFSMSPAEGLILLGALYGGSVYGGSLTAILLNIPGAPANVGTILDGYPMAKNGEAQKALYISLIASVIGGTVSVIALFIFAPPLAQFALRFGPAETFWIAIFGLTVIASLGDTKYLVKGLIGGALGVLIGTIGVSPTSGVPRFTFGMSQLVGGIDLVAALIGLFAFAQALVFFEQLKDGLLITLDKTKGIFRESLKTVFRSPRLTFLSSILGTVIGVVPGAGGQVASIVSYDQAKRYSKNRKNFGKGVPEGIIAPEAANNATFGGALVPLLTLGIPGSPTAAVLLGGLLIHGLWPGPDLFTVNAEVTYTFMSALLVAQFIMLIGGAFGIPLFAKVLKTPQYYLAPIIVLLCIFGSFAIRNNVFDVYVMFACGILGYFALKMGIHPATVVLGIILGPFAETGLQRGMLIGGADGSALKYFFSTPISLGIIALILLSILSTIFFEFFKHRKQKEIDSETSEEIAASKQSLFSFNQYIFSRESLMALFFILFGALTYFFYASNLDKGAGLLPSIMLLTIAFLGIVQWFVSRRYPIESLSHVPWLLILEVMLTSFVLIILAQVFLGYYAASFLFMSYLPIRINKNIGNKITSKLAVRSVIVSLFFVLFIYLSFGLLLKVPIPTGIF